MVNKQGRKKLKLLHTCAFRIIMTNKQILCKFKWYVKHIDSKVTICPSSRFSYLLTNEYNY